MIQREFAIEIKAPVEKVFAFTTDFRNFVRWQDGVISASQQPDGPTRPNTTFTLTRTFLGQRLEAAGAVTEFVPNRKCAFRTTSGPIKLEVAQSFEPTPGGTQLTLHLQAEPGGVFKLAEGAMERQLNASFEAQVRKLKAVLES